MRTEPRGREPSSRSTRPRKDEVAGERKRARFHRSTLQATACRSVGAPLQRRRPVPPFARNSWAREEASRLLELLRMPQSTHKDRLTRGDATAERPIARWWWPWLARHVVTVATGGLLCASCTDDSNAAADAARGSGGDGGAQTAIDARVDGAPNGDVAADAAGLDARTKDGAAMGDGSGGQDARDDGSTGAHCSTYGGGGPRTSEAGADAATGGDPLIPGIRYFLPWGFPRAHRGQRGIHDPHFASVAATPRRAGAHRTLLLSGQSNDV